MVVITKSYYGPGLQHSTKLLGYVETLREYADEVEKLLKREGQQYSVNEDGDFIVADSICTTYSCVMLHYGIN